MRGIYIIGQTERTGTNFLFKLLLEHEDIIKSNHPGEDRLLMEISKLNEYINLTSSKWSEKWKGMNKDKYSSLLLNTMTDSLLNYLTPLNSTNKYIITKSPSTIGISYFLKFFPQFKPIILIRDGRNVVESLVQSFNYTYSQAMYQWAESGERILQELSKNEKHYLVLRYESLYSNPAVEINKILSFVNLSNNRYDFDKINEIPVIGSSQSTLEKGKVDWDVVINKNKFNPNERYKNWNFITRMKYNRICSKVAKKFNYKSV